MPLAFRFGTITEHMACRNDAVMFDVSHLGTVRVTGPDAFDRLQETLTNDLARINTGRAQYTHLLDDEGSVIDDIIVWWVEDDVFDVMPNASNTESVRSALGGEDVTSTRAIIAIQGPHARARIGEVLPEAATVPRFDVKPMMWNESMITVAGTGYTGEDGVEIAVPVVAAAQLWAALRESGVLPAGLGARDTLRLEAGLPLHGHELGPGITPLQAGLGWVVAWNKHTFRGKEALEVERAAGVSRRLRGLITDGRQPPRTGNRVYANGATTAIGEVTSGNYSPVLERGIALAFLDADIDVGARVEIDIRGTSHAAEVVRTPFVSKDARA